MLRNKIMNRFHWCGKLSEMESEEIKQSGVRLYDGDKKTPFDDGDLILTTHRVIWRDSQQESKSMGLKLQYVVFVEEVNATWTKSAKIIAHLSIPEEETVQGPVKYSPYNYVKFSFKSGGQQEFFRALTDVLEKKPWEDIVASLPKGKKYRAGIVGIERQLQARHEATDKNISVAFEDLTCLMEMAKEMVSLSKGIAQKLKEKQGVITEDETIQFKSYLLSLGIDDPVTRDAYGSGSEYHMELAKQLADILQQPLKDAGGTLSLTDVYCRVNRARGMELISPEDLINSCKMFKSLGLPVTLRTFDSGVTVIQLESHDQSSDLSETHIHLVEKGSLTADELSVIVGTTVILAKERLLDLERQGIACCDDSVEGLRFYNNLFLENC